MSDTKTEYKPETVFLFRESMAAVTEQLRQKGPEYAAGRICQLEMDLAAHRNGVIHMTHRVEALFKYAAELEQKLAAEASNSMKRFDEVMRLESKCVDLQAEIRKLKSKPKAKGK